MQIDLTQITTAIITLLATMITYYLVPYLKNRRLLFWTKLAIQAAEKKFDAPKMGKEKNDYVRKFLRSKGFTINEEEVEILIEGALFEVENSLDNNE